MAGKAFIRKLTYSVDQYSLAQTIVPNLAARIESGVAPLAQARGLTIERERTAYKMASGHAVPGLYNMKWKAAKGMLPGFNVSLKHDKGNYLNVTVKASPWYPSAVVVAIVVGSILSYFYLPWLLSDFFRNIGNPLIIVGMIIVFILSLVYVIRSLILSGIIALVSTVTFGFIAGAILGWFIASSMSDTKHGTALKPGLMEIIARVDAPMPYAPAMAPSVAGGYAPYAANPYAAAAPPMRVAPLANTRPPAPGAPPRMHPPASPAAPRYGGPPPAAAARPTAPCPTCSKPVFIGSPKCLGCGLNLVWD